MNESRRVEVEAACERLVNAYCHFVDHGEASRIADLFTEDGVWTSVENTMTGKQEILQGFQAREDNKARVSKHVCSTFYLSEVSNTHAKGCVYLTLYRDDGIEGRRFAALTGPIGIGEYQDEFVITDNGWKFKRREAIFNFIPPRDSE